MLDENVTRLHLAATKADRASTRISDRAEASRAGVMSLIRPRCRHFGLLTQIKKTFSFVLVEQNMITQPVPVKARYQLKARHQLKARDQVNRDQAIKACPQAGSAISPGVTEPVVHPAAAGASARHRL